MLSDGHYQIGDETTDLEHAIAKLGPAQTTQVVISGCQTAHFRTVFRVKEALETAGYDRISFQKMDNALCK